MKCEEPYESNIIEDYFNRLQICNSCYEQMEWMRPIGFKSNFEFKKCRRCNKREDYLNESQICNSCYKPMTVFVPSGNEVIDNFIKYTFGMEFIPYSRFKDVEFFAEGGFSKVYKAMWIENYGSNRKLAIALKELNNSKNISSRELNEVKYFANF